ncbi:MAG: ABC transporter permease [Bacteroidaceae bacterium]|nr:ABC transporter permease [Bacteroidaceae bacterium]
MPKIKQAFLWSFGLTERFIIFLRHAFALIRADKLFSTIYVAGTAVAIASAMVIAIVLNIMLADIRPEVNRSRTLYTVNTFVKESKVGGRVLAGLSTEAIDSCFKKMQCVEAVAGTSIIYSQGFVVSDMEHLHKVGVLDKICNPDFFRLYEFRFLSGRPFSEKEFRDGERVCVITDKLAKSIHLALKEDEVSILLNEQPFRVVGVMKETSVLMRESAADIYFPYSTNLYGTNLEIGEPDVSYSGHVDARILLKKGFTRKDFLEEFEPLRKHYEAVASSKIGEGVSWAFRADSYYHHAAWFGFDTDNRTFTLAINLLPPVLLMLLFLLLPAINLSGLVSNRMEARRAEMGIRKAFGAKRRKLLWEVLFENMVLTLCGGLVGWLLSWLCIWAISENAVFLVILARGELHNANVSLDFQMFFTPTLFLVCFVCCAVLNHMAAFMPAWRSLRKPIVESLNQKR